MAVSWVWNCGPTSCVRRIVAWRCRSSPRPIAQSAKTAPQQRPVEVEVQPTFEHV